MPEAADLVLGRMLTHNSDERVKHILVIDDDDGIRETIAMLLQDAGFEVTTTCSTENASRLFGELLFDVIICDLYLFSEELMETSLEVGLNFVSHLATRCPQTPVVAMSGYLPQNSIHIMQKFGACGILEKPFGKNELLEAIYSSSVNTLG